MLLLDAAQLALALGIETARRVKASDSALPAKIVLAAAEALLIFCPRDQGNVTFDRT
jgi:hypothetical protein